MTDSWEYIIWTIRGKNNDIQGIFMRNPYPICLPSTHHPTLYHSFSPYDPEILVYL